MTTMLNTDVVSFIILLTYQLLGLALWVWKSQNFFLNDWQILAGSLTLMNLGERERERKRERERAPEWPSESLCTRSFKTAL